jgi:hypothetical protein
MRDIITIIGGIIVAVTGILFISFLCSWPVYMLWNGCLVGAVAGVNEVSWLQAWGLAVLCGLLFKTNVERKSK